MQSADILGVPVARPVVNETTALGAAYWPVCRGLLVKQGGDRPKVGRRHQLPAANGCHREGKLAAGWKGHV